MSNLKQRLRVGYKATGVMLTIFDHPEMARILHECGFDYFFFDTEHGYANYDRLYALFAYARMTKITAFLRIPEINKTEVLRAVEMGVDGIFAPIVETAEQARELVFHAKYFPSGSRGVNFSRPHTAYKKVNASEYMKTANEENILICMIESPEGVKNVDDILSVDGIDGVMIGHNDLSQSMGIFGQLEHPDYQAAVQNILSSCTKHGKFCGMSSDNMDGLAKTIRMGVALNQWTSDTGIFMQSIRENLKKIEDLKQS